MLAFLLLPLCAASALAQTFGAPVVLDTPSGSVAGSTLLSNPSGKGYSGFYGLPYGEFPGGRLTPSVMRTDFGQEGTFDASLALLQSQGTNLQVRNASDNIHYIYFLLALSSVLATQPGQDLPGRSN